MHWLAWSAAVADATEADGVTTELLLDAVTDAWMQNFPAFTEDCFTNHLAATHAKVVASYKPLAHARQGLVIFGLVAGSGGNQINSRIKLHLVIACGMALEMAFEMALEWLFGKPATPSRTMFNQARC